MAEPYIGEIRTFSFSWAPQDWALCNGAILTVQQNQALFAVLGNAFGGDGQVNFALPDLRGRTPVGQGVVAGSPIPTYNRGNNGGAENVTLVANQVPSHTHTMTAYTQNGTTTQMLAGAVISSLVSTKSGSPTNFSSYLPAADWTADTQLNAASVSVFGGGSGHNNMQPFTVVNFCICQIGYFPPRN